MHCRICAADVSVSLVFGPSPYIAVQADPVCLLVWRWRARSRVGNTWQSGLRSQHVIVATICKNWNWHLVTSCFGRCHQFLRNHSWVHMYITSSLWGTYTRTNQRMVLLPKLHIFTRPTAGCRRLRRCKISSLGCYSRYLRLKRNSLA